MQRVIGLDVGSYSIKAIEIVNTFKTYEITNFYENIIPQIPGVAPDIIIPTCMKQLFEENNIVADRILTAMPGQYISSRILNFPFADRKKVTTAVLAEVEDMVPFNIDDMVVDTQLLGLQEGRTDALAVMTRKTFLRAFLDHLQKINIDPKLVDVDSLSFYNLISHLPVTPEEIVAIVDVGHEKTSLCIVKDGILRMFRSINLGGRYITDFLARDFEVSFNEAQRLKHRVSRVITREFTEESLGSLSTEDKVVAERITLAVNTIIKELGRTFYAFKTREKIKISRMFLSGGTSKIVDFNKHLEYQLEIQVETTRLDETNLKINPELSKYVHIMPQSAAIGIRGTTSIKRLSEVNLRRDEFAYTQNYEAALKNISLVFKILSVVLLLLCVSYSVKYFSHKHQISKVKNEYYKMYKQYVPNAKRIKKNVAFRKIRKKANSALQRSLQLKKDEITKFTRENSSSKALVALWEISNSLPQRDKTKVNITKFQYQDIQPNGKLILKGETDSYKSVGVITDSLKKVKVFKTVKDAKSGPKPGTDGKTIEFSVAIEYSEGI